MILKLKLLNSIRVLAIVGMGASVVNASATPRTSTLPLLGGRTSSSLVEFGDVDNYQIGDVWGKLPLTTDQVRRGSSTLRKAARATARYAGMLGGATGFYMGKFNGQHVMGTNYHVVKGVGCSGVRLNFPFLGANGVTVKCQRVIGHWTAIDFGLIVLDVPADLENEFNGVGVNFAFSQDIERGTPLLTVGFGVAKNAGQKNMMVNQDNDCRVYSNTGDYRFLADPDTMNPGPYLAWSFAHGCDISHGDSGSAFFNRSTGEMIGVVWTAATPKDPRVLTRDYLDRLDGSNPEVWSRLGYTVPATKIGEILRDAQAKLPGTDSAIVGSILAQ